VNVNVGLHVGLTDWRLASVSLTVSTASLFSLPVCCVIFVSVSTLGLGPVHRAKHMPSLWTLCACVNVNVSIAASIRIRWPYSFSCHPF
jgi:hypothetical protein